MSKSTMQCVIQATQETFSYAYENLRNGILFALLVCAIGAVLFVPVYIFEDVMKLSTWETLLYSVIIYAVVAAVVTVGVKAKEICEASHD